MNVRKTRAFVGFLVRLVVVAVIVAAVYELCHYVATKPQTMCFKSGDGYIVETWYSDGSKRVEMGY